MLLVERSGFGLNELLGANQCSEMECDICKAVRQNWEEQAATIEPQPAAGNATDEREQGRHWVKRERSVRIAQPVPDAKGNSGDEHHSPRRSEEHTSELQSIMRISYAVFCLKKKKTNI